MTTNFKNVYRNLSTAAALAMLALLTCGQSLAQQAARPTFPSAEGADRALFTAIQSHDEQTAMKILGVNEDGMFSGDDVQDKADRDQFMQKYREMHRLGREPDGAMVLYVGAENWPFPFPLVSKNGAWYFDSGAGMNEVLFRRIGENEKAAIGRMQALAEQEQQHGGTAGTAGIPPNDKPFHGYYFRTIASKPKKSEAGKDEAAFVAYPAEYRSCGVMTFIVNRDGVVYERDLGSSTTKRATAIKKFDVGRNWHPVE